MIVNRQMRGFAGDYTVQEGDSIEAIASRAGISWSTIARANGWPIDSAFINETALTPGQSISIPVTGPSAFTGALPFVAAGIAALALAAYFSRKP